RDRFPRLLRTDLWRGSRAERFFQALMGRAESASRPSRARLRLASVGGMGLRLEPLEARQMLSVNYYVDDNWVISTDTGAMGLSPGDTVTNPGAGDVTPTVSATYGVNAFSTITDALTAAGTSGTEIDVLSGTYAESLSISAANNNAHIV